MSSISDYLKSLSSTSFSDDDDDDDDDNNHNNNNNNNNNHRSSFLLLDGGTGEELFRRGLPDDRTIWSAMAVLRPEYHDLLEQVHTSYLQAGAQAITTNSYGIVPGAGFDDVERRSELLAIAGSVARRAVAKHSSTAYVLGSLGPLVESYRPDRIRPHPDGVKDYGIACTALSPYVDAFLAETMSGWEESKQVLEAVSSLSLPPTQKPLPVLVSYSLNSDGKLRDGTPISECIQNVLEYAAKEKVEVLAILFNCCEPEAITIALTQVAADAKLQEQLHQADVVLGAYANRLTAIDSNWTMTESDGPQPHRNDLDECHYWNDFVQPWTSKTLDVKIVGGCCGITPEQIAYIHNEQRSRTKSGRRG